MSSTPVVDSRTGFAGRLLALDVFRGWTIAFMIIVNTPGNGARSWGPLRHASWHGFTPTDLVFPSFLFIIGVSAWFSLKKLQGQERGPVLGRIWRRTAVLFLIGMLMWYVPGLLVAPFRSGLVEYVKEVVANVRVLGVLGRLALCYGIGCSLALALRPRGLVGVSVVLLLAYWGIMAAFGTGADPYALTTNAALRFDLWLLGPNHLYHGESVNGERFAFDPEGVLSTLPAVVTFVIGYLAGRFLDRTANRREALSELFPTALLLLAAGFLWDYWLGFPINKKLWTSSYTLWVGGLSMALLAMAVWLVDVHGQRRWLSFFDVFGKNPLLAYLVSEMGVVILDLIRVPMSNGQTQSGYQWLYTNTAAAVAGDTGLGSFLFSVGYMAACWVFSWICFRRGLVLKI